MKKICLFLSIVTLLCCILAVTAFAASERIAWGGQTMLGDPTYAKFNYDENQTTVKLQYDRVGYSYVNAKCVNPEASFTTTIQKRGFLWTWSDKLTANGTINSTNEYGLIADLGDGTYRFLFTPYNTSNQTAGGFLAPINIQEFYSNSNTGS